MKNWFVLYFRGAYLTESHLMNKRQAQTFMNTHIDGHYMENLKGKRIYKHPKNVIKLCEEDYDFFVSVLDNPDKINKSLNKIFKK